MIYRCHADDHVAHEKYHYNLLAYDEMKVGVSNFRAYINCGA